MAKVRIIGAGISGLTSALALLEDGHSVTVQARTWNGDTCSGVAGAVWYPVRLSPGRATRLWAKESFFQWKALSNDPASGVRMVRGTKKFFRPMGTPWWKSFVPIEIHPFGDGTGEFAMTLPLIDPAVCLPYLCHLIQDQGGHLLSGTAQPAVDDELILWCTGGESGSLFDDPHLTTRPGGAIVSADVSPSFSLAGDAPGGAQNRVPRQRGTFIGTINDNETYQRLEFRSESPVLEHTWGVRGMRPTLRIGWEDHQRVGFNYGHGTNGYTLSWGCARHLASSLRARRAKQSHGTAVCSEVASSLHSSH